MMKYGGDCVDIYSDIPVTIFACAEPHRRKVAFLLPPDNRLRLLNVLIRYCLFELSLTISSLSADMTAVSEKRLVSACHDRLATSWPCCRYLFSSPSSSIVQAASFAGEANVFPSTMYVCCSVASRTKNVLEG